MKVICSKENLLNGVNTVLKSISSRSTLPILECIYLQASNDSFKLAGNDLELAIESRVHGSIIETGSVAIEAKIFSEIVRKLPDSDITIVVDEKNMATITCEKSKFTILGNPGSEFIQLPEVKKENNFIISQFDLKEIIRQTIFSIAIDEIRPIFTGELIQVENNNLNIVSIDGYRVSIRSINLDKEVSNFSIIVPGKALNEISKILTNDDESLVNVYYTDKHVLFEIDDSIVVSRLLEGEFPNYNQMFSKDYETLITIKRKDMISSLERASLMIRESKKNPIKIEINKNTLLITSNTELGNVYEEIDINREGNDLIISFNPKYLIEALKAIDDEEITLQFTNQVNPCIIRKINGDDYKYLILPIKTNS